MDAGGRTTKKVVEMNPSRIAMTKGTSARITESRKSDKKISKEVLY